MQMEGSASSYASTALLFLAMTSSQFRHNKHTLQLNIFNPFVGSFLGLNFFFRNAVHKFGCSLSVLSVTHP